MDAPHPSRFWHRVPGCLAFRVAFSPIGVRHSWAIISFLVVFGVLLPNVSFCAICDRAPAADLLFVLKTQRLGLYAFTTSMVIFTLYIGAILMWVDGDLPCKCNLIVENLSWPQHIAFNLGYITLAVFALWLDHTLRKNIKKETT